jgi:hypothetical protein
MTRATITIYDEWTKEPLVCIYKHCDGYPDGIGDKIREIARHYRIVNGISGNMNNIANSMGCFAAFLIKELKQDVGDVYITSIGTREQYNYHMRLAGEYVETTCDEDEDW